MIERADKKRMQEFLVDRLRGQYKIAPAKFQLSTDLTDCLVLDNGTAILLADKGFKDFEAVLEELQGDNYGFKNFGVVFYKDRKTYFRSAAQHVHAAMMHTSTPYDTAEVQKIISLTPAEIIAKNLTGDKLQYYQPRSKQLEEAIVTYSVRPVSEIVRVHAQDPKHQNLYVLEPQFQQNEPSQIIGGMIVPVNVPDSKD